MALDGSHCARVSSPSDTAAATGRRPRVPRPPWLEAIEQRWGQRLAQRPYVVPALKLGVVIPLLFLARGRRPDAGNG